MNSCRAKAPLRQAEIGARAPSAGFASAGSASLRASIAGINPSGSCEGGLI